MLEVVKLAPCRHGLLQSTDIQGALIMINIPSTIIKNVLRNGKEPHKGA